MKVIYLFIISFMVSSIQAKELGTLEKVGYSYLAADYAVFKTIMFDIDEVMQESDGLPFKFKGCRLYDEDNIVVQESLEGIGLCIYTLLYADAQNKKHIIMDAELATGQKFKIKSELKFKSNLGLFAYKYIDSWMNDEKLPLELDMKLVLLEQDVFFEELLTYAESEIETTESQFLKNLYDSGFFTKASRILPVSATINLNPTSETEPQLMIDIQTNKGIKYRFYSTSDISFNSEDIRFKGEKYETSK